MAGAFGPDADDRLQNRSRHLIGQCQEAQLREIEREIPAQQRITRDQQGLRQIVQKMGAAGPNQDRQIPRPALRC